MHPVTLDDLTNSQREIVSWLKRDILRHDSYSSSDEQAAEKYEYKQFELTRLEGSRRILLYTVVGMKDDERTLASIFCRTRRHIAIGPHGKTQLLNPRNGSRTIVGYSRCLHTPTT